MKKPALIVFISVIISLLATFSAKADDVTFAVSDDGKYCTITGDDFTTCTVTITEGKFHQVKRMFLALNNEVIYLKRIAIGGLKLDESLKSGEYRELTAEELALLD